MLQHRNRHTERFSDEENQGHKEDILCVVQCPPFLLATSSYDGEIIVWNVISGHMYCKLNTPRPIDGRDHREGPDRSVSQLAFLKTRLTTLDSASASLISNGPGGSVHFWRLFSGCGLIADFTPSREKAQVSSIVVTTGDTLVYLADQHGFIHVYDIQEYGLRGTELRAPKAVTSWRAHVSVVTSLELIEEDSVLLSSSLDCTVRLWSRDGAFIGTFGQNHPWDVYTPDSWGHPRVPFEILTDPWSMPTHLLLETDVPAGRSGGRQEEDPVTEKVLCETGKSPSPPSPEGTVAEAEVKADKSHRAAAVYHGRQSSARGKPCWKMPELKWPSIYQTLRCHELAGVSALWEKPDLSVTSSDLFPVSFHSQE